MKNIVLVNPVAGNSDKSPKIKELAEGYFSNRGESYSFFISEYSGHTTEIVREVFLGAEPGERVNIYCAGGDGTVNEAVNGIDFDKDHALYPFPCGSGNDFVKTLCRTFKPTLATFDIWENEIAPCDVIRSAGRININICSVGLDAVVAVKAQRIKRYPLCSGKMSYLIAIFTTVFGGARYQFSVFIDGEKSHFESFMLVAAANGQFYGGGVHAVPEADITDGALDFILVKSIPRMRILPLLMKYMSGRHSEISREYLDYKRGKRLTLKAEKEMPVNFDGEIKYIKDLEFVVEPAKLKVAKIKAL